MDELLKELNTVFVLISNIPVTHDNVDVMATARAKLRRVYAELDKINGKGENENGDSVSKLHSELVSKDE
jgi:hypothetical protein